MKNANNLRDFVIASPLVPQPQNNATHFAGKWRAMSTDQGGCQPALGVAHRAAVRASASGMPEKTGKVIPG